jgi:hypothetical protein
VIARPHPLVLSDQPFCPCLKVGNKMVPAEIPPGIGLEYDRVAPAPVALHRLFKAILDDERCLRLCWRDSDFV